LVIYGGIVKLVEDLKKINNISDEQLKIIIKFLNSTEKDNRLTLIHKWCKENDFDIDIFDDCYSLIFFIVKEFIIENGMNDGIEEFEKTVLELRNCDEEISKAWGRLKLILPQLDIFSNKIKSRLLENIFPSLDEFNIVCDVRPVLDLERTAVNQLLYQTIITLNLSNSEQDIIFECDEDTLVKLKKNIDKALNKNKLIKSSLNVTNN
jgi:hypothetical protein